MARVRIDAGVCGFITDVTATSDDSQHVDLEFASTCPHVMNAAGSFETVDAYSEIFKKLTQTHTYEVLSEHLPHVACPVYAGVLKAIEAAAVLALPRPASITFLDE